jgi:NAD(P)-dependent dehydrogenase (short-subunit alcohol dehydrogenase family)
MASPIDLKTLCSLSDRVALITGAGSGIGSYIAHAFVQAGASRVYITGRRKEALERTAQYNSSVIIPIQGDVSTRAGCIAIHDKFTEAEKERAGSTSGQVAPLDILVNNAGIMTNDGSWERDAPAEVVAEALLKAADDDWAKAFSINVSAMQVRYLF